MNSCKKQIMKAAVVIFIPKPSVVTDPIPTLATSQHAI